MKFLNLAARHIAPAAVLIGFIAFLPNNSTSAAYAKQINVQNYGALGDGSDQTKQIREAISEAKSGDVIYFPQRKNTKGTASPGIYCHSAPLLFKNLSVKGDGAANTQLVATNIDDGALEFEGAKVSISLVTVSYSEPESSTNNQASGILLYGVKNFAVKSVSIQNTAGHAILVDGCTLGSISLSTIAEAMPLSSALLRAGVCIENSKDITVSQNTFPSNSMAVSVNNSGIASAVKQNIAILSNLIQNSNVVNGLNAITVAGVNTCIISNNNISDIAGGINVYANNIQGYGPIINLTINDNTFSNTPQNIYVEADSSGSTSAKVTLQQLTISGNIMKTNNPGTGIQVVGGVPYTISGVTVTKNDIENVIMAPGVWLDNVGNATVSNNSIDNTLAAVYLGQGVSGNCIVDNNFCQNCGPMSASNLSLPPSHNAVIDLEATAAGGTDLTSVQIENNSYNGTNSPSSGLSAYIFDGAPSHLLKSDKVSGNKTDTTLPTIVTP